MNLIAASPKRPRLPLQNAFRMARQNAFAHGQSSHGRLRGFLDRVRRFQSHVRCTLTGCDVLQSGCDALWAVCGVLLPGGDASQGVRDALFPGCEALWAMCRLRAGYCCLNLVECGLLFLTCVSPRSIPRHFARPTGENRERGDSNPSQLRFFCLLL
jgi:hypothetical protein